ncbi:MAG: hypothetical protein SGJ04_08440 [Bacteroidota bacterium]|nr:hypothetical protein [Bacteroidota bacterium]
METIKELLKVIEDYQLYDFSKLDLYNVKKKKGRLEEFANQIKNGFDKSTKTEKSELGDINFRMLRSRLKRKLYNNILFLYKADKDLGYYQNYAELYRQLTIGRFLFGVSAKIAGTEILTSINKKSRKYEVFDIVVQSAIILRRQNMLEGDIKKFEYFTNQIEYYNDLIIKEIECETLHYRILLYLNKSTAISPDLKRDSENAIIRMLEIRKTYNTFRIQFLLHELQSIYLQMIGDYESALISCQEFEEYLQHNEVFYTSSRMASIYATRISCNLHLGKYDEALKEVEVTLPLFKKETNNWFSIQEIHFLAHLNKENLKQAALVYIEVMGYVKGGQLLKNQQERWHIFGGYLWFMIKFKKNNEVIKLLNDNNQTLRISRILNDIPLFSRDKKGANLAVLILQILILLQDRNYTEIISRTQALRSYYYRNMKDEDYIRNYCFTSMMVKLQQTDFDVSKLQVSKLLEQMSQTKLKYTSTANRLEIIPYEKLWEITLSLSRQY